MRIAEGTARTRGSVACCTKACPTNGAIAVTTNNNRAIFCALCTKIGGGAGIATAIVRPPPTNRGGITDCVCYLQLAQILGSVATGRHSLLNVPTPAPSYWWWP